MTLRADQFDFDLPDDLVAQVAGRRGSSRLLVLPRKSGPVQHRRFRDLPACLKPGDCLVVNDSRVLPARLFARKVDGGGVVEILLHRRLAPGTWEALARPCRRLRAGAHLKIGSNFITVLTILGQGRVRLAFAGPGTDAVVIRRHGLTPLPPYIRRPRGGRGPGEGRDRRRYQTIFAGEEGSVAAPTAGLHFTPALIGKLTERGIAVARLTLHVGWGTFAPLPESLSPDTKLHPEWYTLSAEDAARIEERRRAGGRVIAVGTTAVRTLETVARRHHGRLTADSGETDLFITPGYAWRAVQGLVTNFHLPRSSLLMLVCAFGGRERVLAAYREAVRRHYRFYSYGDAMLMC